MADFIPVNELERLLVRAASDPANRPAFYRALPEHDLFVITEGGKPKREQEVTSNEETPLQVRMIELEGKMHIPIFTSMERIFRRGECRGWFCCNERWRLAKAAS